MMESEATVIMAREISGSILSRSVDQLHSVANRLLARCTETQETNTCEKPLSQTHVLIAVIIATAYDLSSSIDPIIHYPDGKLHVANPCGPCSSLLLLGSVLLVLFWLHLRRRKLDKLEDASDPFELAAYGIEQPAAQKKRRRDRLRAIMSGR